MPNPLSFIKRLTFFSPHPPLPDMVLFTAPPPAPMNTRDRIYEAVHLSGFGGMCAEEISNETRIPLNTVRPRVVELRSLGALHTYTTVHAVTASGRKAKVYVTVQNAVESPFE